MMNIVTRTHIGKIRKNNEDNYYTAPLTNYPAHYIVLVSDGVGGKAFGEVASQTVVDVFALLIKQNKLDVATDISMSESMLEMSARRAHLAIAAKGKSDKQYLGMSCTLIALLIDNSAVTFVNVGDSRLYHFAEGYLSQVSEDQTVARALLKAGRINEDALTTHPDRNVLQHALGVEALNHPIEPQTDQFTWQLNDKLLLCSDGLTDMVNDDDIENAMNNHHGDALVEQLVKLALDAGGKDNITIVLCENM